VRWKSGFAIFVVIRARHMSMAFIARCAVAARSGRRRCRSRWCSEAPSRSALRESAENGNRNRRITSAEVVVAISMSEKATKPSKTVTVSERNLQSAALRLFPKNNKLVSPEVDYLRRVLGDRATQQQIDEKVLQVRKLPWSEIVHD
jgi:hypothetical protein